MTRFVYTALVSIALLGCVSKRGGPNTPAAGERWIGKVTIDGNSAFSEDDILEGLVTQAPSGIFIRTRVRYDAALIETDRRRIEVFYQQRGFFDAEVAPVQSSKRSGLETGVVFGVTEGKPSLISAIEIEGLPDADREALRALIDAKADVKVGDRFVYTKYDLAKEQIVVNLRDQGYAHVKLTSQATVDRPVHKVVLRYEIDRGPRVTFGNIHVFGLNIVPESAVRNRIAFSEGEQFSAQAIADSRAQLRELGRFGVIRIDFADNTRAATSDIAVTVSEGPRRELRLGGGAAFDGGLSLDSSQFLIRARAGYTIKGIIDPLTELDVELRPGYSFQTSNTGNRSFVGEAEARLSRHDLWVPLLRGEARVSYDIRASDAYTSRGPGFRLQTERPLWHRRLKVGIGWQIELLCFTDRPAILGDPSSDEYDAALAERLGLDRSCATFDLPKLSSYKLAFFEESIALEGRDNLLETRKGYFLEARFEQAGAFTGSEFGYVKVTPEARAYYPLGSRIVFAARVRYGRAFGDLPITRRYFSGGASSQRGFGQRQLAPVAGDLETSDIEIGGDELLETSIESRIDLFPLWGSILGLALFVDGGDVSEGAASVDPTNLHLATGAGLRYRTPIGPFRLDVAYRATRKGAGEIHAGDSYAWHLSIGEAF